jgi:hypothetical protein
MASASSSFDGTETPLSEGGAWAAGGGGLGAWQKISGHARPSATSIHSVMAYTAPTWADDQTSTALRSGTGVLTGNFAGVAVRVNVALGNGYAFTANEGTNYSIYRIDAGGFSVLGAVYAVTPTLSDTISLSIVGDTLTPSVNGVPLATRTDPTPHASGAPGLHGFQDVTNDMFDAWSAVDSAEEEEPTVAGGAFHQTISRTRGYGRWR